MQQTHVYSDAWPVEKHEEAGQSTQELRKVEPQPEPYSDEEELYDLVEDGKDTKPAAETGKLPRYSQVMKN